MPTPRSRPGRIAMTAGGWIICGIAAWLIAVIGVGVFVFRRSQRSDRRHIRSRTTLARRHANPHTAQQQPRRGRHHQPDGARSRRAAQLRGHGGGQWDDDPGREDERFRRDAEQIR